MIKHAYIIGALRRVAQYLCVLSVFSAMLYLQGCSSGSQAPDLAAIRAAVLEARAEEQQLIRSTIQYPRRLDASLLLLERRDEALRIYVSEIEKYRRDFELLNADYAAQRTDFEELVLRFNEQRAKVKVRVY